MSKPLEWQTESAAETQAFGRLLAERLAPHELIALSGPLGSGKTQLVKGLAAGLGVPEEEPVVSPTFVLVREYVGRLRLYHLDAYRLRDPRELLDLGLEEMLEDDAVVAVEWADRVGAALPPAAWTIELGHVSEHARRLVVHAADAARLHALGRVLRPLRGAR